MAGLIHCYTGDGKGKTTAAAGLALRAAGRGMRVLFAQFLKDGSSGEIAALKSLPLVTCVPCPKHSGFFRSMTEEERKETRRVSSAYFEEVAGRAVKEGCDLLVLDEFMAAYTLGILDREQALSFLRKKPAELEVVLTGRDVPEEVAALCDYITECRKVKHPFDRGITARKGIEY